MYSVAYLETKNFVAQKFTKESGAMLGKNFMIKYVVESHWSLYTQRWYSLNQ